MLNIGELYRRKSETLAMRQNRHLLPFGLAASVGLLSWLVIPATGIAHRWANACFYSGMFLAIIGLFRLSRKLGSGDLFLFSWGRIGYVLRSKKEATPEYFPETYFEYRESKKQNEYTVRAPLMLGAALVLFSFFLSTR